MSPVEPPSPVSMEISPISPSRAGTRASMPDTPVIEPSLYLPRLVTSFRRASSIISLISEEEKVFQLTTPSPLSLNQTPVMIEQTQNPATQGRQQCASFERRDSMIVSTTSSDITFRESPNGHIHSAQTPVAVRRVSSLVRQNANEGLEILVADLGQSILETQIDQVRPLPVHRISCSSASSCNVEVTTVLSPRPRSRSPISKHRYHRRSTLQQRISQNNGSKIVTTLLVRPSISPTTQNRNREIQARIAHLARPLVPLVSVVTGASHPSFPTCLLQYQLLTHEQLDDLARWYHQTEHGGACRWAYPCPIGYGKVWIGAGQDTDANIDLQTKRRRWGRFIGLRGCESPVVSGEEIEELEARMEREWREAMRLAREMDAAKEKMGRGWQ